MMRTHRKTEIYSFQLSDAKSKLVFSDEELPLEILGSASASGDGRAYAKAILREWHDGASPVTSDTAIYELALDGSNTFRRVLDDQSNQSAPQFNMQGTKAALQTFIDGKFFISTYSVSNWQLLRKISLFDLMSKTCAACTPVDFGWMADGNRLFVELTVIGDDDEDAVPSAPGAYVISEEGSSMRRIPDNTAAFRLDGYTHSQSVERRFVGQLPDESYVFQDFATRRGNPASALDAFLIIGRSATDAVTVIPLKAYMARGVFSPTGKYLVFVANKTTPDYRPEQHLRVVDLHSNAEWDLISLPPPGPPSSLEPNVFLSLLGWRN